MTLDEQLILENAREIFALKQRVADLESGIKNARNLIYSIGGPLNDNRLKYTKEQQTDFARIAAYLSEPDDNDC